VDNFVPSPKVPVHIFHLENIVNYVFEDFRKTKAPNIATKKLRKKKLGDECPAKHMSPDIARDTNFIA
jgi:hypothetical protein